MMATAALGETRRRMMICWDGPQRAGRVKRLSGQRHDFFLIMPTTNNSTMAPTVEPMKPAP